MTKQQTQTAWPALNLLERKLVVSCQASPGEPLDDPEHILALCLSAINGGAGGLRLEGVENIALVRRHTTLPIIGLVKSAHVADEERLEKVYITATIEEARSVAAAGADIVAVDATGRLRPDGLSLPDLIGHIHVELARPVWADVSTVAEGTGAVDCGADVVSTTLYGYTKETEKPAEAGPDFELLADLCRRLPVPVALEGRVWQPAEVARAFASGAFTVVVGSAITRPQLITSRFVRAIPPA